MNSSEIFQEEPTITGDSREVIATYFEDWLLELKKELSNVTLEQPGRILLICSRIKVITNKLRTINSEKAVAPDHTGRQFNMPSGYHKFLNASLSISPDPLRISNTG